MNDNQTARELEHRIAILELKLRIAELERDMALEGMSARQGEQALVYQPLEPLAPGQLVDRTFVPSIVQGERAVVHLPLEPVRYGKPTRQPYIWPSSPSIFHRYTTVTTPDTTGFDSMGTNVYAEP